MPFRVKGHHGGIRLRRNHKLPTIEIVAPQVTFQDIRKYDYFGSNCKLPFTIQSTFTDTNKQGVIFTKGSGHSQEGDLVNDCTPPHRTVVGQSGPLPHNTVHPRFLHYTTGTRIAQHTSVQRLNRKSTAMLKRPVHQLTCHPVVQSFLFLWEAQVYGLVSLRGPGV